MNYGCQPRRLIVPFGLAEALLVVDVDDAVLLLELAEVLEAAWWR